MTNTRQTDRYQSGNTGETSVMNHDLVRDHIDDLLREGAALRAERNEAHRSHREPRVETHGHEGPGTPVRVRLGRWLVGVGWAVAGGPDSPETARRAA